MWFRVDNRLIHGQVIEGWLPMLGARHLVVANDELAEDPLRQEILCLAVSRHVDVHFVHPDEVVRLLTELGTETFVLFENCQDVRNAWQHGLRLHTLNIGNIHYGPGRKQIYPHIALSEDDIEILCSLVRECETKLDFRAVPAETVRVPDELLR